MSVYKRYRGETVKPDHKDYEKGTWYMRRKVYGQLIHRSLPMARSGVDALCLEEEIIDKLCKKLRKEPGMLNKASSLVGDGEKTEYVYIIESAGCYKIGFTTDFERRFKNISNGLPFETKLLLLVKVKNGRKFETELHTLCHEYGIKNEWFSLPPVMVEKVIGKMVITKPLCTGSAEVALGLKVR